MDEPVNQTQLPLMLQQNNQKNLQRRFQHGSNDKIWKEKKQKQNEKQNKKKNFMRFVIKNATEATQKQSKVKNKKDTQDTQKTKQKQIDAKLQFKQ